MQETLHQTADAGDSIRQRMQFLYQTVDAVVSTSDSECKSLSIRQRMQETLYQTADAEESLSDSGCRRLYQTADAGDTQSDSGCRISSIR